MSSLEKKSSRKNTLKRNEAKVGQGVLLLYLAAGDDFHLVKALCSVIKENVGQASEALVKIMIGVGKSVELLRWAISCEIHNNAAHLSNLFRGRSPATMFMSPFYKIEGKNYLMKLLSEPIRKISFVIKEEYEIDSTRLDDGVEDKTEEFMIQTLELAQELIDLISASACDCPLPLRLLFRKAREEVDAFNPNFCLRAVGSFVILRFICPCLATPEVYGLTEQAPRPHIRKALVQITKLLQLLANKTLPGENTPHFDLCMDFVTKNQQKMLDFFDQLTIIDENLEKSYDNWAKQKLEAAETEEVLNRLGDELSFVLNLIFQYKDNIQEYLDKDQKYKESLDNFVDFLELVTSRKRKGLFQRKDSARNRRHSLSSPSVPNFNTFAKNNNAKIGDLGNNSVNMNMGGNNSLSSSGGNSQYKLGSSGTTKFGSMTFGDLNLNLNSNNGNNDDGDNVTKFGNQLKDELVAKIGQIENFWRSIAMQERKKNQMYRNEIGVLKQQIRKQIHAHDTEDNEKENLRKKLDSIIMSKLMLEENVKGLEQDNIHTTKRLKEEIVRRKEAEVENNQLRRKIRSLKRKTLMSNNTDKSSQCSKDGTKSLISVSESEESLSTDENENESDVKNNTSDDETVKLLEKKVSEFGHKSNPDAAIPVLTDSITDEDEECDLLYFLQTSQPPNHKLKK